MNNKELLTNFIEYAKSRHIFPILHSDIEPLVDDYLSEQLLQQNTMLAVVFRPNESEFRTQKHLMDAEGTTDTEPSKEAVFNYVKSCGYYADAIDVWYDTMQHIWRWSCNIIEVQ